MVEREIKGQLREWIAAANGSMQPEEISDDLGVLAQGVLSSLQLLELVQFIEKLGGKRVTPGKLKAQNFESVTMIYRSFFAEQPD